MYTVNIRNMMKRKKNNFAFNIKSFIYKQSFNRKRPHGRERITSLYEGGMWQFILYEHIILLIMSLDENQKAK